MPIRWKVAARAALGSLLALTVSSIEIAAQTISTGPPASPSPVTFNWFGQTWPGRYTEAQSFTVVPAYTTLTSFTFHLLDLNDFSALTYRAYLAPWDPAARRTTGPMLW